MEGSAIITPLASMPAGVGPHLDSISILGQDQKTGHAGADTKGQPR